MKLLITADPASSPMIHLRGREVQQAEAAVSDVGAIRAGDELDA